MTETLWTKNPTGERVYSHCGSYEGRVGPDAMTDILWKAREPAA